MSTLWHLPLSPTATWFCIQCLCRLFQGLPISLLELNTFGHAACALLIYALWWHKPHDVSEPYLLAGEDVDRLAACMYANKLFHVWAFDSCDDLESIYIRHRLHFWVRPRPFAHPIRHWVDLRPGELFEALNLFANAAHVWYVAAKPPSLTPIRFLSFWTHQRWRVEDSDCMIGINRCYPHIPSRDLNCHQMNMSSCMIINVNLETQNQVFASGDSKHIYTVLGDCNRNEAF